MLTDLVSSLSSQVFCSEFTMLLTDDATERSYLIATFIIKSSEHDEDFYYSCPELPEKDAIVISVLELCDKFENQHSEELCDLVQTFMSNINFETFWFPKLSEVAQEAFDVHEITHSCLLGVFCFCRCLARNISLNQQTDKRVCDLSDYLALIVNQYTFDWGMAQWLYFCMMNTE